MISRCPSCGSETPADANVCPSCGWDFVARRRVPGFTPKPPPPPAAGLPPARPAAPPSAPAPEPKPLGGFSLPPAKDLGRAGPPPLPPGVVPESELKARKDEPSSAAREPLPETRAPEKADPELPERAPQANKPEPPKKPQPEKKKAEEPPMLPGRRMSMYVAALAGSALGLVSALAVYMLVRPDPEAAGGPGRPTRWRGGESAPGAAAPELPEAAPPAAPEPSPAPQPPPPAPVPAPPPQPPAPPPPAPKPVPAPPPPAPAAPPAPPAPKPAAPKDEGRRSATFAPVPKVAIASESRDGKDRRAGQVWKFEGGVADVMTEKPVFAARLSFYDPTGRMLAEASTDERGRYSVSLPAGTSAGYALKVHHPDYTSRFLDGRAAAAALGATPEEKRLLVQAARTGKGWVGKPGETVEMDVLLVGRTN